MTSSPSESNPPRSGLDCAALRAGLWIVVPAFCESAVVGSVVSALRERYDRVVVVDDGSSDDTASAALAAGAVVLRHPVNLGQGAALQTGMEYAISRGATCVCTFDADGQHPVAAIDTMLGAMAQHPVDVVLGSRFLADSEVPAIKRAVLAAALLFTRIHARLPITDTHNGLRLLGPRALEQIRITQPGMAHASEILQQIGARRLRWMEVPTRISYTAYSVAKGQSVFNAVKILLDLLYSAWSRRT
jgi:glycosyltransferase involved in cell wall biosynthesis